MWSGHATFFFYLLTAFLLRRLWIAEAFFIHSDGAHPASGKKEIDWEIIIMTVVCTQGYWERVPDKPFHHLRASKLGVGLLSFSLGTLCHGFWWARVVKGPVGFFEAYYYLERTHYIAWTAQFELFRIIVKNYRVRLWHFYVGGSIDFLHLIPKKISHSGKRRNKNRTIAKPNCVAGFVYYSCAGLQVQISCSCETFLRWAFEGRNCLIKVAHFPNI